MAVCPNCGSQQPDGAAFCDECGAKLAAVIPSAVPAPAAPPPASQAPTVAAATCPVCGMPVIPGEPFCNSCGAALGPVAASMAPTVAVSSAAPTVAVSSAAPTVAVSSMQPPAAPVCPTCGAQLEPGSRFCDMCGAAVAAPAAEAPAPAPPEPAPLAPTQVAPASYPTPIPAPAPVAHGRLVVQGTNATLPFPVGKTEIIVGREDPVSNVFPEIDLTDHGGDEGGVSRRHARIVIQGVDIFIEDLNSTNYTYVNQQRLMPGQPQSLKDGDELRFGRVKATFYAA
ncbi:MAG: zinc ribbon domain-containing protein [Anaerolineae bacterium]|nr:zinc ribbon domain-containing protein [Anaerolineae bacterium]